MLAVILISFWGRAYRAAGIPEKMRPGTHHAWNLTSTMKHMRKKMLAEDFHLVGASPDGNLTRLVANHYPPYMGKAADCPPMNLPQSLANQVAYLADAYILPAVKDGETQVILTIVDSGIRDRSQNVKDLSDQEDEAYLKDEQQRMASMKITCDDGSTIYTATKHPMRVKGSFNDWLCIVPSKQRIAEEGSVSSWFDLVLKIEIHANISLSKHIPVG
jgi:hypothetical protein